MRLSSLMSFGLGVAPASHNPFVIAITNGGCNVRSVGVWLANCHDTAKAKVAYQDFLTLWKDADPGIPIYKEATLRLGPDDSRQPWKLA
jgi:hypothetical protein